jgi:hypothetical protein
MPDKGTPISRDLRGEHAVVGLAEENSRPATPSPNPKVLIGILSPSARAFNASLKFHHYNRLPSFQKRGLSSRAQPVIDILRRRENAGGARRAKALGRFAVRR